MKTERFEYLYLLFGILLGFLLGSSLEHEAGVWVRRALSAGAILFVAFCGALLAPLLLYLGHQEWNDCARESEIRTLRKTAEFISSKQN